MWAERGKSGEEEPEGGSRGRRVSVDPWPPGSMEAATRRRQAESDQACALKRPLWLLGGGWTQGQRTRGTPGQGLD